MGMFDYVNFKCPQCGEEVTTQSKAGDCTLANYDLYTAPVAIKADLDKEVIRCKGCGRTITLRVQCMVVVL